jgi:hypothetical protein
MKKNWKYSRWLLTAAVAGFLVVQTGTASADLATCQNDIDTQSLVLQSAIFKALQGCKNLILKEQVKNLAKANSGSVANAAKACEAKLKVVYGAQVGAVASATSIGKFRAQCTKWRTGKCKTGGAPCTTNSQCVGVGNVCLTHCRDEDIASVSGHGHLLSGSAGNAPPAVGDAGKFMCDWATIAMEKIAIKQQLFLIPDTVNIISAAQGASPDHIATNGKAAHKGTSCSSTNTDPNLQEYRPNLCRFGVECRDHACSLAGTSQATLLSAPLEGLLGGPATLNLTGSVVIEFCQLGQATGTCKDVPHPVCQTDADCPVSPTNKCNMNRGEGEGSLFLAEPNIIYLINEPSKTIKVTIPPALAGLVAAVCVDNIRSEGWCDCTGSSGVLRNTDFCIDQSLNDNPGCVTDDCGSSCSAAVTSSLYPGTKNGALKITPSGAATAGTCLDLQTTQFTIILATSDFGVDTIACTGDDFGAPSAPAQLPITSGTATASIKDAVASPGTCNISGFCQVNADCAANLCSAAVAGICSVDGAACTGGPNLPGTCVSNQPCSGGPTLTDITVGPLTGAATNCTNYSTSNLSGLSLVGAFPALGTDFNNPLGDSVTGFKLTCN